MHGTWTIQSTGLLDPNQAILFADRNGRLREVPQRRYLALVDGIIAGEGEGPLGASPVQSGLLIAGRDPALVDWVVARTIGFDPSRIPMIQQALGGTLLPSGRVEDLDMVVEGPPFKRPFRPPRSWPSLRNGA